MAGSAQTLGHGLHSLLSLLQDRSVMRAITSLTQSALVLQEPLANSVLDLPLTMSLHIVAALTCKAVVAALLATVDEASADAIRLLFLEEPLLVVTVHAHVVLAPSVEVIPACSIQPLPVRKGVGIVAVLAEVTILAVSFEKLEADLTVTSQLLGILGVILLLEFFYVLPQAFLTERPTAVADGAFNVVLFHMFTESRLGPEGFATLFACEECDL